MNKAASLVNIPPVQGSERTIPLRFIRKAPAPGGAEICDLYQAASPDQQSIPDFHRHIATPQSRPTPSPSSDAFSQNLTNRNIEVSDHL
jgi:hypothetical protein